MLIFIAEILGTGLPLALPRPRAIAKKLEGSPALGYGKYFDILAALKVRRFLNLTI
ncbi:MAG: hypothetical protein IM477_01365 [Microcystis sp. M090S1]|jgi:hypothetical protein|nr:hypothetical protein [Microcystis aeruginosa PMC 728.11]MBE9075242.1 hypothetical protein [Microcystis sp. LEGE 08355]MCA2811256.1 hypothetical protein [Microcystis sp. M090S1]